MLYSRSFLVTYFKHNTVCLSVNPKLLIYPPYFVIPFGNSKFVLYVCGSNSVLYISSFVLFLFFRFHIKGISCDICLSRSDLLSFFPMKVKVLVIQSCPTLCYPMDCNPPNSSVHENFQARILEWVAIPLSRGYIYVC